MAPNETPLTDDEFTSAVILLRELIPEEEIAAYSLQDSPTTVYTTLVTLWLLTLQRLGGGKSLSAVVKDVVSLNADLLPDNKRVREGTLSERSGTYSVARKRLPLETVRSFAERVSQSLIDRSPAWLGEQRAFIIDGTTLTLAPTSNLRNAYPPATNQHGETVWPVLMLMVAHELVSGCALIPELGAMYGPQNTSEARQAAAIGARIPRGSLILADAGFGIFSVAFAMVGQGHDLLFRLTRSRFKSLRRKAEKITETDRATHYRVTWNNTPKVRQKNPDLPADASLEVYLHEIKLESGDHLYLVTTLAISSQMAADSYARRYDVEHDIRDMKVSLGIENIRAKCEKMVQKELLCSVVAYNLVIHLRREAAKIARVPPRQLSFTGVWTSMKVYLLQQPPCTAAEWLARYERALRSASQAILYKRKPRSYPRRAHPRRPKSTKFMKQERREKSLEDPPAESK
jgi:hypothetical protein